MNNRKKVEFILHVTARIAGIAILGFLLFFIFAHIFGNDEAGEGFRSAREVLTFVFFPITTTAGLLIALRNQGLGGLITVGGMILFYIFSGNWWFNIFTITIIISGMLYIGDWYLSRKNSGSRVK